MKTAILADTSQKIHSSSWAFPWIEYCKSNGLDYKVVNPFTIGVMSELLQYDIILWHFSNYHFSDMLMARNILFSLEHAGKKVFPSVNDAWHFDDKLAETYLLESVQAPMPQTFYFYSMKAVELALQQQTVPFPIVAKLRNGSGSHNVKMLENAEELMNYAKKMFGPGLSSAPSLLYKTSSNLRSARNFSTFVKRAKRIPEFLRSLANAKRFNRERGYVLLQEFIPNDGFDIKIAVVGDKLSMIGRQIRKGDFRASGGGTLFYDKEVVVPNIIESAFKTSESLGFQCMGYDYVVDQKTGVGKIVEISYGFSHDALLAASGYFDRQGRWYDEPLNVPEEIIKNLIS